MSSNGSDILTNWTFSDVDFTKDCERSANFLAKLYQQGWLEDGVIGMSSYPFAELMSVLRSISPDPFRNVSRGAIVDWVIALDDNLPLPVVIFRTSEICRVELCPKLQWEGNADLAGIGVRLLGSLEAPALMYWYRNRYFSHISSK